MLHEQASALFAPTSIRRSEQQRATPQRGCHARSAKMEIIFAPSETSFLTCLHSNSTFLAENERQPVPLRRTSLLPKKRKEPLSPGSSARSQHPITIFASSIFSWR